MSSEHLNDAPVAPNLVPQLKAIREAINGLVEGKLVRDSRLIPNEFRKFIRKKTGTVMSNKRLSARYDAIGEWVPKPETIPILRQSLSILKSNQIEDCIVLAHIRCEANQMSGKLMALLVTEILLPRDHTAPDDDSSESGENEKSASDKSERVKISLTVVELLSRIVQVAQEEKNADAARFGVNCIVQSAPATLNIGWSTRRTRGGGLCFTDSGRALLDHAISKMESKYPQIFGAGDGPSDDAPVAEESVDDGSD